MTRIGLTGRKGSGKDTAANYLCHNYGFQRIAFADAVREEAEAAFGLPAGFLNEIPHAKRENPRFYLSDCSDADFVRVVQQINPALEMLSYRTLLQYWGTEYRRAQDKHYWTNKVKDFLEGSTASVVVTDVRFPDEANMLLELGSVLVEVRPVGVEPALSADSHVSEAGGIPADTVILNPWGNPSTLYDNLDSFAAAFQL